VADLAPGWGWPRSDATWSSASTTAQRRATGGRLAFRVALPASAGASVTRMSPSLPGLRPSTIEVDGRAVALDTGGAGPPVLLLHGFPQTRHAWRLVAPQLTDRFAVV
jgi:hypothetical protein